jgi:hypothetical protein
MGKWRSAAAIPGPGQWQAADGLTTGDALGKSAK